MKDGIINPNILDLGCGSDCLPGAVGLDIIKFPGVEVHDLNIYPWPLKDSQFDKIRCKHIIEHIQKLDVLVNEIYRVSRHNAIVYFITPHYSSYNSWRDPRHIHHFAIGSIPLLFEQVLGKEKFYLVSNELNFFESIKPFGRLIYKMSPKKYEKHFAWMLPAGDIHTKIQIIKG